MPASLGHVAGCGVARREPAQASSLHQRLVPSRTVPERPRVRGEAEARDSSATDAGQLVKGGRCACPPLVPTGMRRPLARFRAPRYSGGMTKPYKAFNVIRSDRGRVVEVSKPMTYEEARTAEYKDPGVRIVPRHVGRGMEKGLQRR